MPKAGCMKHLVQNGSLVHAASAQGEHLSSSCSSNSAVTSLVFQDMDIVLLVGSGLPLNAAETNKIDRLFCKMSEILYS